MTEEMAQHVRREEGDYIGEDGLLYCGKCHTRKQTMVNVLGNIMTPYVACKCSQERYAKEVEEKKRREFEERVRDMRKAGFPDEEMMRWTFERDDGKDTKLSTVAHRFVDKFPTMLKDGKGLLLYGDVGTGKSYAAACIANALVDKGVPCMMTNMPRLVNTLSGMLEGKQGYIDRLNSFALLVIDDLGTERGTDYVSELVYNIIDSRYRAGLPLIVTTNLTLKDMAAETDVKKQRIYSRLYDMCIPMAVAGKDRRRENVKQAMQDYKDLLGM